MKKLILLAICTLIVASLCCGVVAFASTTLEEKIKKIDGVEDVRIACCEDVCIVAVKPSGVMQKTECQKIRQQIIQIVEQNNDKLHVVVTFSPKAFFHIERLEKLPDDLKQVEIERLIDKLSKIPMPLDMTRKMDD